MKLYLVLISFFTFSSAFARADVNLRNGNFFYTFTDIRFPGGLEPKIERVYNSKSSFTGMFGYGWSSEYETYLRQDPDGSLIVASYGGGTENRFVPKNYQNKDLDKGVAQILEVSKKSGMLSSEKQIKEYETKLRNDFSFRSQQYGYFVNKGLLPKKVLTDGLQFTSTQFLYQYITKVKGGYVQVLEAGNIHKYNEAGKLVQIQDRNKNFINFSYNPNGQLVQLVDQQNRKMVLSYNKQGWVEKVTGESGKSATYQYGKDNQLSYSKDETGKEFTYAYTQDAYANLIEIGFPNEKDSKGKTKRMQIGYYPLEKFMQVKSVINPDHTSNEYEYLRDPKKPEYYGVHVLVKDADGARISDSKYEYTTHVRPGGQTYTSRMVATVDGDVTETLYDEKLGFPVKITHNQRVTTMQYDAKGRMLKKVTPTETTELSYDQTVGKVNKVIRKQKSGPVRWSMFEYDRSNGNLTLAKNSEKKQVKLIYDTQGRIRALIDQTGRQLTFKYNEISKPIEIADAKLGTVKFTYKNSGEVDKVESNGGSNVASAVMATLQDLIDITAPSGVSMSI